MRNTYTFVSVLNYTLKFITCDSNLSVRKSVVSSGYAQKNFLSLLFIFHSLHRVSFNLNRERHIPKGCFH